MCMMPRPCRFTAWVREAVLELAQEPAPWFRLKHEAKVAALQDLLNTDTLCDVARFKKYLKVRASSLLSAHGVWTRGWARGTRRGTRALLAARRCCAGARRSTRTTRRSQAAAAILGPALPAAPPATPLHQSYN